MNIKNHIEKAMEYRHAPLVKNSICRIIRGEYRPRIGIAKELAAITDSRLDIWLNPDYSAERQIVVGKLAVRLGMEYFTSRGRPRKIKMKSKKAKGEKSCRNTKT